MQTASTFLERARALPRLGIGISTEHGAGDAPGALDLFALRAARPDLAAFLEIGVETSKGLDRHAEAWLDRGWPATFHFLDVNLDDPEDFDPDWLDDVRALRDRIRPAWMCGDAGLWHFGARDRGQLLLLPPVLTDDSASALAEGVARLREETGLEVLPENPPGAFFVGDLHLLDFFARVAERADTGLLLDVAHLAIYQRSCGFASTDGFDGFPWERVTEVHVAGGVERDLDGYRWVEDDHSPAPLADTWAIFERVAASAPNLKAVVFECERNPVATCLPALERIASIWPGAGEGA